MPESRKRLNKKLEANLEETNQINKKNCRVLELINKSTKAEASGCFTDCYCQQSWALFADCTSTLNTRITRPIFFAIVVDVS